VSESVGDGNSPRASEPAMTKVPRKRRWLMRGGLVVAGVVAVAVVATTLASWRRPELGVVEGELRPCPDSPNCVSSFEPRESHHVAALPVQGDPESALPRLVAVVDAMPGASLIAETDDYAHIEFVSPVMRYVDDVELLLDEAAGEIHIRSASRVGHSDLGANRARVEAIRERWESAATEETVE